MPASTKARVLPAAPSSHGRPNIQKLSETVVSVRLRDARFAPRTRQRALPEYTDATRDVYLVAQRRAAVVSLVVAASASPVRSSPSS